MSIYSSGVGAYRDTTKWLTAFVPITSLATAALVLGPGLITSLQTESSLNSWLEHYWIVLLAAIAILGGIAAIMFYGARVLSVEPADIGDLTNGRIATAALAAAIGSGATTPYFLDINSFNAVMSDWANSLDSAEAVKEDDPRLVRLKPAVDALRDWSIYHRIQGPFRTFVWVFVAATTAISAAILTAPAQLDSSTAIEKPTKVEIEVDAAGHTALQRATGCSKADTSIFFATGGTWNRPVLAADGPGCRFGATWRPDPSHIELRLPAQDST